MCREDYPRGWSLRVAVLGGGYATKSWKEMITSGVSLDKVMQRKSLQWIREQSMDANCIESLATHDTDIKPHVIEL